MLFAYGSIKKHPPVREKHDFTHGNLMNMKVLKTVAAIAAIVVSAGCSRQTVGVDEYLIKGVVRNIPDSTVISLMRSDGRLAVRVAQDTVIGGRFEFRTRSQAERFSSGCARSARASLIIYFRSG